jgi:signal transduction histidine kinase
MSLQTKFVLLVGMLGLAVATSIAAAVWSFGLLKRELSVPFASAASVLEGLAKIKRATEDQLGIVLGSGDAPPHPPGQSGPSAHPDAPARTHGVRRPEGELEDRRATTEEIERFEELGRTIGVAADAMRREDWYRARIATGTWRNLTSRIEGAQGLARQWFTDGSGESRTEASSALFQIHELIEKTELRILEDANAAVSYGRVVQSQLLLWLACVSLVAVLTGVLAVVLLRRWVRHPVASLRQAAARIATGDFAHRVPVTSRDELGQLSAEVNHMARMVLEMQEERVGRERLAAIGGMVRRLAHNVRNPLAGIRGLAEVTRHDLPEKSEGRENLELIVSTVDTFERWLNDLLESTVPDKIAPRACGVRPWIEKVVETHQPMAQARGVRLRLDAAGAPDQATFDPRHLDHALAAILSNAIEVSPADDEVSVRVASDEQGGVWEVRVQDHGPGVPEDLKQRIFEPHFTTKKHGTGIGLAVALEVVKAHGGRIDVESGPENGAAPRGACFRVRMPMASGTEGAKSTGNLAGTGREGG